MRWCLEIRDSVRLEGGVHIGNLTPTRLSSPKFTETNARFANRMGPQLSTYISRMS